MAGTPNLITRYTEPLEKNINLSQMGGMLKRANCSVIEGLNGRVAVVKLFRTVRKNIGEYIPPTTERTGHATAARGWETAKVPPELIELMDSVHVAIFPKLGEHLSIPQNLNPVENSIQGFGTFHIDPFTDANMVLHEPEDMKSDKMRSIVTIFKQSAGMHSHPLKQDLSESDAIGLYPGDALLFGKEVVHEVAQAEDVGLTDLHPGCFGQDGSAHLLDLERR